MKLIYFLGILLVVSDSDVIANSEYPNVVLIVADDLGWDDVSYHGSNITLTPNIDLLAHTGVALARYYSHCVCTPSRAALLTGKYSYTIGMHGYPLTNGEDRGLPLDEKLLPQYLKELGYSTHLIGKWHLGMHGTKYLPMSRGFDSHFGHRGGFVDYYEYTSEETWDIGAVSGFDLYRNLTAAWDVEGYLTDVYTDEAVSIIEEHDETKPLFLMLAHNAVHSGNDGAVLQAPPEVVREMRYVESPERRIFTAMVKKLDDSVGDVIGALAKKNILGNSIIVFISDNGGITRGLSMNYASNWPLRGTKLSPFEGGVRVAGIIWSPRVQFKNNLWDGYMHVVDWIPTLFGAIGVNFSTTIDGKNLWHNIVSNTPSNREDFFNYDDYMGFSSFTSGHYKLITGNVNKPYSLPHGSEFNGTIGNVPKYTQSLQGSKVYKVLRKMGGNFHLTDIDLRNRIRVDCQRNMTERNLCFSSNGTYCLFNIKEDPCEIRDVSEEHPELVDRMSARLQEELKRVVPRPAVFRNSSAHPKLHEFTWATWADGI